MDPGSGSDQPGPQQPTQQGHEPPPPAAPFSPFAVAAAVLAQFESLPKSGKPQPHEYTVLAGIALTLPPAPQLPPAAGQPPPPAAAAAGGAAPLGQLTPQQAQHASMQQPQREQQLPPLVVALGTGTKCLPASKRDPSGRAVNDCHAEAACRRALLRWLYCEAAEAVRQHRLGQRDGTAVLQVRPRRPHNCAPPAAGSSAEETLPQPLPLALPEVPAAEKGLPAWELAVRPGVQLHMYVSQPPCGDASILECLGDSSGGLAGGSGACSCSSPGGAAAAGTALAAAQLAGHAGDWPSVRQHAAGGGRSGLTAVPAAGAAAVLGRTGAKPIKRPRLGHAAEQGSSNSAPPDAAALQLLPLAQPEAQPAQQLLQQQHPPAVNHGEQGWRGEAPPAAPGTGPAPGAPAVAASAPSLPPHVPQFHEVESYAEAQAAGVVRRKPGRGEATLSMSCSDKLARWRLLGLQGSLLSGLLAAPLHLSSLTVSLPLPAPQPPAAPAAPTAGGPAGSATLAATEEAGSGPSGTPPPGGETVPQAAVASLQRAVAARTAGLVPTLPAAYRQALLAAPLALCAHCPEQGGGMATAATLAAGEGAEEGDAAAGRGQQGGCQVMEAGPAGPAGPAGTAAPAASPNLGWGRLEGLGLVASGRRKVAGGSTLVWHAPPSTQVLGKSGLKPAPQQAQQPPGGGPAGPAAPVPPAAAAAAAGRPGVMVVRGGVQEAVVGTTGVKLGHARKGAGPPPPAAAPCISREALLKLFLQLVGELTSLPLPVVEPCGDAAAAAAAPGGPPTEHVGPAAAASAGGTAGAAASAGGTSGAGAGGIAGAVAGALGELSTQRTYRQLKHTAGAAYQAAWQGALQAQGGPFEGWIPKPHHFEEFTLDQ